MLNFQTFKFSYLYLSYVLFYFCTISDIGNQSEYTIYLYLIFALILCILLNNIVKSKVYLDKFTITLIVFNFYILLRSLFDTGDLSAFKNFSLNSSSGILFGYFLGLFTILVYNSIVESELINVKRLLNIFIVVLLFSATYISYLLSTETEKVQVEVFYTSEVGFYQRPGDLTIIYSALNYLIFTVISDRLNSESKLLQLLVIIINVLLIIYMQFIGSNAATLFLLLLVGYHFVKAIRKKIKNKRYSKIAVVALCCLILIMVTTVSIDKFDEVSNQIKFFGFNVAEDNSLISRLNIVYENSVKHFMHAPFWGHVNVDEETSTKGAFIHSIFSVFLHLGLIGLLFVMYIINYTHYKLKKISGITKYKKFYSFLIFKYQILLLISTLFTFFTWTPLWFLLTLINGIRKKVK